MSTDVIYYTDTDPMGHCDITATIGLATAADSRGPLLLPVLLESAGSRRPGVVEWLPLLTSDTDQIAACRAAVEAEVARRAALPEVEG